MTRAELRRELAAALAERAAAGDDSARWVAASVRVRIAEARLRELVDAAPVSETPWRSHEPVRACAPRRESAGLRRSRRGPVPASTPRRFASRPVDRPRWVRVLAWPLRHWRLTLAAGAVALLWAYRATVVMGLEVAAGAALVTVALAVLLFTGRPGRRPRRSRR